LFFDSSVTRNFGIAQPPAARPLVGGGGYFAAATGVPQVMPGPATNRLR
jgi:hypothetical protein